jgi:hypothetical protein
MKAFSLLIICVLLVSVELFPQKGKLRNEEMRERFEELEKIKLIETLQMDEETTLRFFARQSAHKSEQKEIQEQIQTNIDELETIFVSGRAVTDADIQLKIDEINALQLQLETNRIEFLSSLYDILTVEQVAQLIIFEKKFRNEVRRMIMRDRKPPINQE